MGAALRGFACVSQQRAHLRPAITAAGADGPLFHSGVKHDNPNQLPGSLGIHQPVNHDRLLPCPVTMLTSTLPLMPGTLPKLEYCHRSQG